MRQNGAILLLLILGMPAIAAEPPAPASEEIPWYRRVFLGERSKPALKPVMAAKPAAPTREGIARSYEQEKEVYLQRLASISKLRQLADDRNDEAMMKKADELEKNAQELFEQRTAALKSDTMAADRAALEKKPATERPATAERPGARRRPIPGETDR